MNITQINAKTIPDAWYTCLYQLIEKARTGHGVRKYNVATGSDAGQDRIEFDFVVVDIEQPWHRPLLPCMPEGSGLPPIGDEKYLSEYMVYLLSPAKSANEEYTYGERFAPQFERVIEYYKKFGPNTNRMCIEIAKADDLFLYNMDDAEGSSPCWRLCDCKWDEKTNKLDWFVYFRSWSLLNGFPLNLAAIQQAKELMAGEIGAEDGRIITASKSLNIRKYALETVVQLLQRDSSCIEQIYGKEKNHD
jgi:thymidylate synthase